MKKNIKLFIIAVIIIIFTGSMFSISKIQKNNLNRWRSFHKASSIKVLKIKKIKIGLYKVQMVNILRELGNANIKEPINVLLKIGNLKPISLGKYLPRGYKYPLGRRENSPGVEPTTFPTNRNSVWKQLRASALQLNQNVLRQNGKILFRGLKGKLKAIISVKILIK